MLVNDHQELDQYPHQLPRDVLAYRFWIYTVSNHMLHKADTVVPQAHDIGREDALAVEHGHPDSMLHVNQPRLVAADDLESSQHPIASASTELFVVIAKQVFE